jgi:hypothetical protein
MGILQGRIKVCHREALRLPRLTQPVLESQAMNGRSLAILGVVGCLTACASILGLDEALPSARPAPTALSSASSSSGAPILDATIDDDSEAGGKRTLGGLTRPAWNGLTVALARTAPIR